VVRHRERLLRRKKDAGDVGKEKRHQVLGMCLTRRRRFREGDRAGRKTRQGSTGESDDRKVVMRKRGKKAADALVDNKLSNGVMAVEGGGPAAEANT